ncbi:MAG TPA: hypothetical protein VGR00_00900, partial [Thermoanaerobaculia bacterium]|nr:hypothetical protein [Thermoanaerobaculia bacterium]
MPNSKRYASLASRALFTSVLVLAVFLAPSGQAATNLSILPGAAETAGQNGAYFSSTLWITNISTGTVNALIGLIPASGAAPAPVAVTIPAGRTQRFLRALSTLFGPNFKSGTITVSADGNLALQLVTQNIADERGTYGLALTPVAENELLTAGKTGHAIWVSQSGDPTVGYRTNVAAALVDKDTSLEVRVFDEAGTLRGTRNVGTATPANWQESVASIAGSELPRGRVEIKVLTGRATGYTAVVDNVTGDGIASQTVAISPTVNDLLLDGVARTPGANGTHWSTDVRLFNPNPSALTVTLDAIGFPTGPASILRTIPANGLVEIQDVLAAFGMPDGVAGALRLHAASPFLAAGRTNNSDPTGQRPGTISAYQQPIPFPAGLVAAPDTAVF